MTYFYTYSAPSFRMSDYSEHESIHHLLAHLDKTGEHFIEEVGKDERGRNIVAHRYWYPNFGVVTNMIFGGALAEEIDFEKV